VLLTLLLTALLIDCGDGGGSQSPHVSQLEFTQTATGFTQPLLVTPAGVRMEIWALGLRNPWRFSYDRLTGDLYISSDRDGVAENFPISETTNTVLSDRRMPVPPTAGNQWAGDVALVHVAFPDL
jgi:hypothetical protein